MNKYLINSVVMASCSVLALWVAYVSVSNESRDLRPPDAAVKQSQAGREIERDLPTLEDAKIKRQADAPKDKRPTPPLVETQKTYWTRERVVSTSSRGVMAIPKCTRITISDVRGDAVTISDGKTEVPARMSQLTSDIGEVMRMQSAGRQ